MSQSHRDRIVAYGIFLAVMVATRFQQIGNPIVHIDEQFYLLVGDRWNHGLLPYVGIWDRKPIGLFVIYALIRRLGGDGIVQYQLVASAFSLATAIVVHGIARRIANALGAILAGCLYLIWITLLTGQGGQSPVFYNLFTALAAATIFTAINLPPGRSPAILRSGTVAMLLVGIAIQIKYSVIFEGIFFGAMLMRATKRSHGWLSLAFNTPVWIAAALLPTVAAMLSYWWIGQFHAFWFANFESIFLRGPLREHEALKNAAALTLFLSPLLILAASGAKHMLRGPKRDDTRFLVGWLIVSILSVAIFGYYFDHYGLPIVLPAAICAAPFVSGGRKTQFWGALVLGTAMLASLVLPTFNAARRGTAAQFWALEKLVEPEARGGLLVWSSLPALYNFAHPPFATRYLFPNHLRDTNEHGAIGVDQLAEVQAILRQKPAVIVEEQRDPAEDSGNARLFLDAEIAAHYRLYADMPVGRHLNHVYVLRR